MKHNMKRAISFMLALLIIFTIVIVPAQTQVAALKKGDSNDAVKTLQNNLIGLGYLSGSADGIYGSKTKTAVQKYQKAYGLDADGIAGANTLISIHNTITRLEVELENAGFYPGVVDGKFTSATKSALKEYQRAKWLSVNGIANDKTWKTINALTPGFKVGTTLKVSSSYNTQVKYLQMNLIGLGYLSGSADGKFGPNTKKAVRNYQKAYGLDADGIAGPKTLVSIKNAVISLQNDLTKKRLYSGLMDGIYDSEVNLAAKKIEYRVSIESLYQTGDQNIITYPGGTKRMNTSGCGGVSLAMALNGIYNTTRYDGYKIMQWYADHGYYYGDGADQKGIMAYAKKEDVDSLLVDTEKDLVYHLKQGRVAIAIVRGKKSNDNFCSATSIGHFVLVSGYRIKDGIGQIYVNNPMKDKTSGWFELSILMDAVKTSYENVFVILGRNF